MIVKGPWPGFNSLFNSSDQMVRLSKTEILKKNPHPTRSSTTTSCNSCKERKGECREKEGGEDYPEVREKLKISQKDEEDKSSTRRGRGVRGSK